ncbi:MAG: bifunctional UDP-N-acetylglucosamine diphosphorylase/glucosamine-1-phosphate N-acetyltransferase GlmU [Chloroflexi bacterium]|nr:bifunctional UDP-N-acetylglucosamine diphosphorylase/glucosamine-1-phosphate N-acetyltransferase GlmU [Chloroflexota bacterium]
MDRLAAVILAAGQGKRLKSRRPKVLHPVAGKSMVSYLLDRLDELAISLRVAIVGNGAEEVQATLGSVAHYVQQTEQLGTGHAVQQAQKLLDKRADTILVLYGDTPLLREETIGQLLAKHASTQAAVTLLTAKGLTPAGYGRIQRDASGRIQEIVEEGEAVGDALLSLEINGGACVFAAEWLWVRLPLLHRHNNGELYLTDLVGIAAREGQTVSSITVSDPEEVLGINTRAQLAQAEAVLRQRIRERFMDEGVTLMDPGSIFIDATVAIGRDTTILPFTIIEGQTRIGEECTIGPFSTLRDAQIGDRCQVRASAVEQATLEDDVILGPYSHVRGGAHLAHGVFLGNYAEVKNAHLGPGTRMHHFSYIGDATLGARVNVGAGTITCNYDSETRAHSETIVGDDVGLGSDTMLVAPIKVGPSALTGAGAVVTQDVPANSVTYGVPAKVRRLRRKIPS